MFGTLYVVSTPIGNLEDITLRAVRLLGEVALIAAEDTRHTAKLLQRYQIKTPTTSLHEHNERQKVPAIMDRLRAGESIAVVSDAGTPGVRDPGFPLVKACIEAGIRVEAVPGASAVLTALVISGLPMDEFTFLGFAPQKASARATFLEQLASEPRVVVFFEAPHRIVKTLEEMCAVLPDRQIVLARELTKIHEEALRGTPGAVLGQLTEPRGEFTVVVAPAPEVEPATVSDESIWKGFNEIVAESKTDRRAAVTTLARRHGLPSKEIYAAIERQKARTERD